MAYKDYYLVKDGKPQCVFVYGAEPEVLARFQMLSVPTRAREVSCRLYCTVWELVCRIGKQTRIEATENAADYETKLVGGGYEKLKNMPLKKVYFGCFEDDDMCVFGEATSYQFVIAEKDGNLFAAAHTPRGRLAAAMHLAASIRVSEDKKDVYVPAEAFGIHDRYIPPMKHAFDRFTVSFYGPPYTYSNDPKVWLEDEKTLQKVVEFGTDEAPIYAWGQKSPEQVAAIRALIRKYNERGVTVRLYGADAHAGDKSHYVTGDFTEMEENIKWFVETYGDMDGISQWGFCDEPAPEHLFACAKAVSFYRQYDPKQRPVYINMGPSVARVGAEDFYDRLAMEVPADYFCFDRYPYFETERGCEKNDVYYYANLELNRYYALDYGRDAGMIIAAIRVGGEAPSADITPDFMKWQSNLLIAYGHRYVEQYVYYYVHEYCMLGHNNEPTFRWQLAKEANEYMHIVGGELLDKRLDAVFHLVNADGTYDADVIPYYGYRNAGEIRGVDALISFFEDGTLIVTDKRCDDFDGGDHDVVLTGIKGETKWFNAASKSWEDIASCPAAKPGEDGLTLTLSRASQYILHNEL